MGMTTLYPSTEPPATIVAVGTCWSCSVAGAFEDPADVAKHCKESGQLNHCFNGNRKCDTVVRKRGGVILSLQMGCTGTESCENNAQDNFTSHYCKPGSKSVHVESRCYTCCDSSNDSCNFNFMDQHEWNPRYIHYTNQ